MEEIAQLATTTDPFLACCLCGRLLRNAVHLSCLHSCCQCCFRAAASLSKSGEVSCCSCDDVTRVGTQLPNEFVDQQVQQYAAVAESRVRGACTENGDVSAFDDQWSPINHQGNASSKLSQDQPADVSYVTFKEDNIMRNKTACSVTSGDAAEPRVAAACDTSGHDAAASEHKAAAYTPQLFASQAIVLPTSDSVMAEKVQSVDATHSALDVQALSTELPQSSAAGAISVESAESERDQSAPKPQQEPEPTGYQPVNSEASEDPSASTKDAASNDQWRPDNPDGKKVYDRAFLLYLQHAKHSLERPEGLPQIDNVVLDKPFDPTSDDWKKDSKKRPATPKGPTGSSVKNARGRGNGGRRPLPADVGPALKVVDISRQEVQLHRSDCAYKPLHMIGGVKLTKSEELSRSFKNILNKVTPQNFERIISSVLDLHIDTEEGLRSVVNLTFEKIDSDPFCSAACAYMCRIIFSSIKVAVDNPGEVVDFRTLLLTRCQREFENNFRDKEEGKAKLLALQKAESEVVKKSLQEEYDSLIFKFSRRFLGNVRFIGELYKQKMFTEVIMHDCIVKLLKDNEEDSLECLCSLLATIGKGIDHEKAKPRNDQYFNQMKKITAQKKVSSRVRFKLQDIIDMRENNWVPRFSYNNPKASDEMHREAVAETQRKNRVKSGLGTSQVSGRGPGGGLIWSESASGGRQKPRVWSSYDKEQHYDDGRNTVGPIKMMQNAQKINPSMMKLSKHNAGDDIQLRPSRGRPNAWIRGSRPTSSQELQKPVTPKRTLARGPTYADSSQEPPRRTEWCRDNDNAGLLLDEDTEKKATTILEEFLHNVDVKEALQSIEELLQTDNMDVLVRCMIVGVLRRSEQARKHTAQLLSEAIKGGLISTVNCLKGLSGVTEAADDLAVDVPHVWTYLSELIAPMLQADSLKMSSLLPICLPLLEADRAGELLAKVLQESTRNLGTEKVADMWSLSGLQWSAFLSSGHDVKSFLTQHKLEFLLGECKSANAHAPVCRKNTSNTIASSLEEILIRTNGSNEDVFNWHEKNVREDPTKRTEFIRALVECVARQAIDQTGGGCILQCEDLQRRAPLLVRFVDKNSELELQALFALQSLLHHLQHPANILRSLFDWLYDEDIISEDAFYRWQKNDDPDEREGKCVALESTKQFFTWLQNADPADP